MLSELDLLTRELYTIADAARITRVPETTVAWWLKGRDHHEPVLRSKSEADLRVRWGDLVSISFLAQLRQTGVRLQSIRDYVLRMRETTSQAFPLARRDVLTNGPNLAWKVEDGFEDTTGHVFDEAKYLTPFLRRIEFDSGGIALVMTPSREHPRVKVHPLLHFGAPQIDGFSTKPLADVVRADLAAIRRARGDVDVPEVEREIARDYGIPVAGLREAVDFETNYMEAMSVAA